MCASSNVTVVEEVPVSKKQQDAVSDDVPEKVESQEKTVSKESSAVKEENVRQEKITLTDNFFDQKPNKEEQEIADVIKELYPDEDKRNGGFKLPDWKILAGIGAAVVIVIIVAVISISSGDSDNEFAEIEDAEEQAEPEEKEKALAKVEDEKEPEEEAVPEEEEEAVAAEEEEEEKAPVEEKPAKKIAEVKKEKAPVVKKKRKPAPKKRKIAKKKALPKKNVDVNKKYNDFVQLGHAALGQKKYTDALHEYKNAMRLKPRSGKIYKFIGIAYAYLQNQNQACKNYRKYIQLTPNASDKAQVQAFLEACP